MEQDTHSCPVCQRSFRQWKHLKRHQSVHENRRHYQCNKCPKSFARKDGLRRHCLVHNETATSLVQSKRRACWRCAASKTRCSGTLPCERCAHKNLNCQYSSKLCSPPRLLDGPNMPLGDRIVNLANEQESRGSRIEDRPTLPRAHPEHGFYEQNSAQGSIYNYLQRSERIGSTPLFGHVDSAMPDSRLMSTIPQTSQAFETSQWNSDLSSTINWLQPDADNPRHAQMSDIFPILSSTNSTTAGYEDGLLSSSSSTSVLGSLKSLLTTSASQEGLNPPPTQSSKSQRDPSLESSVSPDGHDREVGDYYVDGHNARRSRFKRRRVMAYTAQPDPIDLSFHLSSTTSQLSSNSVTQYIDDLQYSQLKTLFRKLCLETEFFSPFISSEFLPPQAFNHLIEHYFEHFHPVMPFLHRPTFQGSARHSILLLAMSALGCRFVERGAALYLCAPLNEFLRRVLLLTYEASQIVSLTDQDLRQVLFLYSIGARYPSSGSHEVAVKAALQECVSKCQHVWNLRHDFQDVQPNKNQWLSWIEREETLRTHFCIWLFDCILASLAERNPILGLVEAAESHLPCIEPLWTAERWETWHSLMQDCFPPPTLQETLHQMYVEKQLSSNLGEFARVIVIHGLYHRTWNVKMYFQHGLSHFEPSAETKSSEFLTSPLPVWHSRMETFNNWRNAALDCLDILHWHANALIGLARGMEHHTVLHLHVSRMVLLSPLKAILELAKFVSVIKTATIVADSTYSSSTKKFNSSPSPSFEEAKVNLRAVQEWMTHDQYKARLAAIHAGSLFWHVRRYSVDAFYEPECIATAALMLWALSKFSTSRKSKPNEDSSESIPKSTTTHIDPRMGDSNSDDTGPSHAPQTESIPVVMDQAQESDTYDIILLDRPVDDELAQQYVRRGHLMYTTMKGVGDLFGPLGAQRVLAEARRILRGLGAWHGSTAHWLGVLERVEAATAESVNVTYLGREELVTTEYRP